MARIAIKINGEEYPCYFTLGAGLIFKQTTGHDVSKMDNTDLVEVGTLLFCQCKSACRREGKDFPFAIEDFLDQITEEDLSVMAEERDAQAKKK